MRKLLAVALVCSGLFSQAQSEVHSSHIKLLERSVGAPNSGSLGKAIDVPVNMFTGVPDIKIPLTVIKSGNISLPITLRYNGSGIKVNDPISWVGAGWTLDCGGVVNKRVNGLDDIYATTHKRDNQFVNSNYVAPDYSLYDNNFGINTITEIIDTIQTSFGSQHVNDFYRLLGRIIQNTIDGESDEYFFSVPGGSGTMYYDQRKGTYKMTRRNGWSCYFGGMNNDAWHITTNTGMAYNFSTVEKTLSPIYYMPDQTFNIPDQYYTSAWYLSSLSDPSSGRDMMFYYDITQHVRTPGGFSQYQDYRWQNGSPAYFRSDSRAHIRYGDEYSLKEIVFDEGKVVFVKDVSPRQDFGPNALKEIRIFDKQGNLKKKFVFNYYYQVASVCNIGVGLTSDQQTRLGKRLFLSSVQEIDYLDNAAVNTKPYSFQYNTSANLPCRFSFAQDIYGYYNGKHANTTIIPTQAELLTMGVPSFADRSIDAAYTKAGILEQITYPTGGTLNLEFQNNVFDDNSLAGGLRIKKVIQTDNVTGKSLTTEYRYVDKNGVPTSHMWYLPKFNYIYYWAASDFTTYSTVRVSGDPIYTLFGNQGTPIYYSEVEKVETSGGMEIKSRYHFNHNYLTSGNYAPPQMVYSNTGFGVPENKHVNEREYAGLPHKTEIFKYENGQYSRIRVDSTEYTPLNYFQDYTWNAQAAWTVGVLSSWLEWTANDPYTVTPMNTIPSINAYKMFSESVVPNERYTKQYDGLKVLETREFFKYDSRNGNVKQKLAIASNGDTLKTYMSYTADFGGTTVSHPVNDQINAMLEINVIAAPVEIISTRKKPGATDELVTEASLYFYENATLKKVFRLKEPVQLSSMTKAYNNNSGFYYDARYELENEVISFDARKNPTEMKSKAKTQSMLWDDNNNMTAQAVNAKGNEIFFDSYEEAGSWNGIVRDPVRVHSGRYSARIDNNTSGEVTWHSNKWLNVSLTQPTKYLMSGWVYSTGPSAELFLFMKQPGEQGYFTYVESVSASAVNKWTYIEKEVLVPANITQLNIRIDNNAPGTLWFDDIRLHPAAAQMVTYTYDPLIGMTSQSDINSLPVYYEYDGLGRLILVKDKDGNVLRKICYNLFNQPENCTVSTSPRWLETGKTRCKPCDQNSAYQTNILQKEQGDANPYSSTYGSLQWVDVGTDNACANISAWQSTSSPLVCETVSGQNTGYQLQEQKDMNPCSPTYNQLRWVNAGYNTGACPLPPPCTTSNCTGDNKKCVNGICETACRENIASSYVRHPVTNQFMWRCTWRYVWSDGSYSQNYVEYNNTQCTLTTICPPEEEG